MTERFDLVGFDARGVRATKPAISGFSKEDYLAGDVRTELVLAAGRFSEDYAKELVSKCAQGSGGEQNLGSVSIRDTVRVIDHAAQTIGRAIDDLYNPAQIDVMRRLQALLGTADEARPGLAPGPA